MHLKILILFIFFTQILYAKKDVYIKNEKSTDEVKVFLVNDTLYDITFKYDAKIKNLLTSANLPIKAYVKSKSKKLVIKYFTSKGKYSVKSKFSYVMGNKNARHNDSYLYSLPFKTGSTYKLSQGFNGKFSHKGNSLYALDFSMPIGTKVYAIREGVVVKLKEDSTKSGNKDNIKDANYLTVKHNDGTYSKYAHLKYNGVEVKIGDKIKRGQFIAYSGNTGYSSGPHLHFLVFKAKDYKSRQSIKIKFISQSGIVINPIKNKAYTSVK